MRTALLLALVVSTVLAVRTVPVPKIGGPSNPIKAIYIDDGNWNSPQDSIIAAAQAGFNAIILAFYMHTGPSDFVQAWASVDSSTQQQTVQQIHSLGAVLMMSFGGGADNNPYVSNPYSMGQTFAKYAQSQNCDGVDFDVENINGGFTVNGMSSSDLINWIVQISQGAASVFGSGGVISHAPQSPYFGPIGDDSTWVGSSGGYTAVYQQASSILTFFNVQYYNQDCYTDYQSTFISAEANCSDFPKTSVKEIAAAGVDMNKIIVGKPVLAGEAGNGWVSGNTLSQWFKQANSDIGWNGGVMGWEWSDNGTTAQWLNEIYAGSSSASTSPAASSYYSLFGTPQNTDGKGSIPDQDVKAFEF